MEVSPPPKRRRARKKLAPANSAVNGNQYILPAASNNINGSLVAVSVADSSSMHLHPPTTFTLNGLSGSIGLSLDSGTQSTATPLNVQQSGTLRYFVPGINPCPVQSFQPRLPSVAVVSSSAGGQTINILGQVVDSVPLHAPFLPDSQNHYFLPFSPFQSATPTGDTNQSYRSVRVMPESGPQMVPNTATNPENSSNEPDEQQRRNFTKNPVFSTEHFPESVVRLEEAFQRFGSPIVSPSGTLAFPPPCTVTTENPRLSTTCRSGIYNFFVTANQPTVSSTPVIPTTSEPERKSPEPAMVILDLVPGSPPKEIPVSEPVAKTPSRETPKPEEPIPKKRPKDLLRHVIGGETIFESLSGPFSSEQMMYIEAYYSRGAESKDASVITGESHSPDHSSDISPDQAKVCEFCRQSKPARLFIGSGRFCTKVCAMHFAKSMRGKSNPKKVSPIKESLVEGTPSSEMAGSVRPPGRPKCVKKMRIAPPEPKKPISVAPSPIPLARTELPAGPLLPSAPFACNTVNVTVPKSGRSKVLAEKSASECVELASDVIAAAPLLILLRDKPDPDGWNEHDIAILLRSVRGLGTFAQQFIDEGIDGQALKFLFENDNNVLTQMNMPRACAHKLKSICRLFRPKDRPFSVEDLYHLL